MLRRWAFAFLPQPLQNRHPAFGQTKPLSLAWGLAAVGQVAEAISLELINESLAQVETNGNRLYIPELLRVKGAILLLRPEANRNTAKACFLKALELSRHQGARAWELRAAIDPAKVLAARGEIDGAHGLFATGIRAFRNLKATERLLATLH